MKNCKNCGHRKFDVCLLSGYFYRAERKYPTSCGPNFIGWIPREGFFPWLKRVLFNKV
jgi:hypothetical protein